VFIQTGLPVVNLANGTEGNHQPDESVTVEALETMLDVTIAIVAQAGRSAQAAP
jgi:di/tripeptidase